MKYFIGIDPGKTGGLSLLTEEGKLAWDPVSFKDMTEKDISNVFKELMLGKFGDVTIFAFLESVHAMPISGKVQCFGLGNSFGLLKGLLYANDIPFELVTPQKWQKDIGCLSKGDKNVTKTKAQQLFPGVKVTHYVADSMLIAEYCRRMKK